MSAALVRAAEGWLAWVAGASVQVLVLAGVVIALDRMLRRRAPPALLAALWWLVLLKLALPPWLSSPLSVARLWPGDAPLAEVFAPSPATGLALPAFLAWLAGLAGLGAAALARRRRVRRAWLGPTSAAPPRLRALAARAARRLGLSRAPALLVHSRDLGPAVVGSLRPVIVLPRVLALGAYRGRLECALLHELAHLRRRDPLASLLALAVQLLFWFHPLAWLAGRRLAALRELSCDEEVARALRGRTDEYRRALLDQARALLLRPAFGRLDFVQGRARILERLERLERPFARPRARERAAGLALTALLLACCVPLARPRSAAPVSGEVCIAELRGCLQLRYAVLGLLAREEVPAAGRAGALSTPPTKRENP